jgi:hypothetical protein
MNITIWAFFAFLSIIVLTTSNSKAAEIKSNTDVSEGKVAFKNSSTVRSYNDSDAKEIDGAALKITASVISTKPRLQVPSNFVGFSSEESAVFDNHIFTGSSGESLARLLNLFGGGVYRLGGDSSDDSFSGDAADAQELANFLKRVSGWSAIVGLNVCNGDELQQAQYAREVTALIPKVEIQLGNEPDLYQNNIKRCRNLYDKHGSYGVDAYTADWQRYSSFIRSKAPGASFAGPDIGSHDEWLAAFLTTRSGELTLATRHFYAICSNRKKSNLADLLRPEVAYPAKLLDGDIKYAASFRLKLRISETNSICGGGIKGISDTLVAANWALYFMMQGIEAGIAGVNFHSNGSPGQGAFYTALREETDSHLWSLQPVGYAMLLVSKIQGMLVLPVVTSVPFADAPICAFLDKNHSVWFLIENRQLNRMLSVSIKQAGLWKTQSVLIMTGQAPSSTNITLGGSDAEGGAWTPKYSILKKGLPIDLAPASAALVKLE